MTGRVNGRANSMRIAKKHNGLFIDALLHGDVSAHRLVQIGDAAQSLRDYNAISQVGVVLQCLPGRYGLAGDFYVTLASNRAGESRARAALADMALKGSARANLALGSDELCAGNPDAALTFYQHAQLGDDLSWFLSALMTAQALGLAGDHSRAVRLLEAIERMAFHVGSNLPAYFYTWINTLAVELGATGNHDRALKLARIAAASPYTAQYPEFRETLREIVDETPQGLVSITYEPVVVQPSRAGAVCRIEKVLCNESYSAAQLHRYAEGGERAIGR
jgi:hypothetical protein